MPDESTASRIADIEKRLNAYRDGDMSQFCFLDDAPEDIAFLLKLAHLWDYMQEDAFEHLTAACFNKLKTPQDKAELRRRWMEWKGLRV